jgi:hypothetical protein
VWTEGEVGEVLGAVVIGRRLRRGLLASCVLPLALAASACSSSGGSSSTSVFDVKPGQCFVAPKDVKAELSTLSQVPCTKPHTQEAYALVTYVPAGSASGGPSASAGGAPYPGGDALDKFAKGACAQHFTAYVGVDYLQSSLYYTYLLPSARSWEQNADRTVLCFVTTTGGTLTTSVKGSRK